MNRKLRLIALVLLTGLHGKAQWTPVPSPTTDPITAVSVPGRDTAYAVTTKSGIGGKIIGTKNGTTWTQQASTSSYLLSVFFRNTTLGWAGGGIMPNGIILKTTDGGATWITINTSIHQIYSIYFTNDTIGYAVGNNPNVGTYHLYKSTDGGSNWTQMQTGFDYLRSIWFSSDSIGYCAGDNGRIFKTTDAGVTWTLLNTGVVFHFNDQCFVSDSTGWSNGQYINGKCYKTTDGGNSWVPQVNPATTKMTSVSFTDQNNGWQVGDNGTIFFTGNGGVNWSVQTSGTTANLSSVRMYDNTNGFAGGNLSGTGAVLLRYESSAVSLNEAMSISLKAWPIPAHDQLCIERGSNEMLTYRLTDVHGRLIRTGMFTGETCTMDIRNLQPGIYFIHPTTNSFAPIRFIKD